MSLENPIGRWHSSKGASLVEILIVVAIVGVVSAMALPNLVSSRRALSSAAMPREIVSLCRAARQMAMSQRQAVTCRYDNASKVISIINHRENGNPTPGVFNPITYDLNSDNTGTDTMVKLSANALASANETADVTVQQFPLFSPGVLASDIVYGKPATAAITALDDGTNLITMPGSNQINITFQPDGTVVNASNVPVNRTLFLYNSKIPSTSAFAISVLGATGRIKLWRINGANYVE
jgi:prepilin-type N-terminal cleavage/methylation domain-containing protein